MYAIANIMKSLIVAVMQTCDDSDTLSLHYSINVLETFFKLHHTLLGFFLAHKDQLAPLLNHQIALFLSSKEEVKAKYRNKQCIPDFGIIFAYLTIWENPRNLKWAQIATQLLDESFIRNQKWVLQKHNIIDNCSKKQRLFACWDTSRVSMRLFMFNYFFYKQCCQLGNGMKVNLQEKLKQYNENCGFPNDVTLPYKLQWFVKRVQTKVTCFAKFFQIIEFRFFLFAYFLLLFVCLFDSKKLFARVCFCLICFLFLF